MVQLELELNMKYGLTLLAIMLSGCQSLGEHYNCMAEVDRLVPAQTQQRYIRTDTKCTSSGTGYQTFSNRYASSGETNCESTPIYETIVLNQTERDAAYQRCRSGINSQRTQQQNQIYQYPSPSVGYQAPPSYSGQKMTIDQAISQCSSDGLRKGTSAYGDCVRKYSQQ